MEGKMGVYRKFTPAGFKQAWKEYFEWCDNNPWMKSEVQRGILVQVPIQRPYTEIGFCSYHELGEKYLRDLYASAKNRSDEESKEFVETLLQARAKCYSQKFEGAAVGIFNANIIARDLGLIDKQKHDVKADYKIESRKPDLSKLSLDQLKTLREINRRLREEGEAG
ncbi:terminase small subunit [Olivibacter sp. CPCC 100613]|uniref:terminase small subunit n=1 Tax=Olivibacter sp. CPCC 100613 TaxID=3079931 RepID=UPI002FF88741